MTRIVLLGSDCEADGHPSKCPGVVDGSVVDADGDTSVSVNGTAVASRGDRMDFPPHEHAIDPVTGACIDTQSHSLQTDQTRPVTVNGQSVVLVGDSTTDPGSGGTADVINSGGNQDVTVTVTT
ncbi:hypothetical protein OSG_eHP12_00090 [environmental Halophage eHP-12]|nr:hypothetical protein OSG_eHP12_00090 [environmental Halophage eHP-12]